VSPFYQENVGGPPDQNPNYSPCTLFLCENLFRFCSFLLLDLDGSSLQNTSVLDAHAKLIHGSYMYGGNSSLFTTPLSSSLILISWFGYAVLSQQDIAKEATWKCFFLKHETLFTVDFYMEIIIFSLGWKNGSLEGKGNTVFFHWRIDHQKTIWGYTSLFQKICIIKICFYP